nr:uncharacterized protein CTRU02_15705 [Colletotrichum truncatum]KAF6780745.1 hypothetical protein CTRU02_15705 [Colletotrichum truncatum]
MPADYVGLEVANNRDDGPEYYVPYQDNIKNPSSYNAQPQHFQEQQQPAYAGAYGGSPPAGNQEKRICGVRTTTFWVALVAAVFFLGTIGASAAAGTIAQQYAGYVQVCETKLEQSTQGSGSAAVSGVAASSATSGTSSTTTTTTTSSSASASASTFNSIPLPKQASSIPGEATTNCPNLASDNKTYTPPGSNLRFVRECGNNYPQNDLGYIPMTTMEDCLNLCAALSVTTQSSKGKCIGVAWVTAGKQGTGENYCWLKNAKGAADPKDNIEAAWLDMS